MSGVKLLVAGFESSGKTTLTSQVKDCLVMNCDNKGYPFKIPHTRISDYRGFTDFKNKVVDAINRYKEKNNGEIPKVIIFDTITQLYSNMVRYNGVMYKGYDSHKMNNSDTLDINHFIENTLLPRMDVIIVAHTKVDDAYGRMVVPAQGAFKDSGSWGSMVSNAIFIDKSTGELIVKLKGFNDISRTTLSDLPEEVVIEKYDINEHLDKLRTVSDEATAYEI